MDMQFSHYHLLNRLAFLYCVLLAPISKISWLYLYGFISGLSVLFHWSICLSLFQYYTVVITMALSIHWILWNQEMWCLSFVLVSTDLFLYLDHLWFHMNFRIFFFYFCKKHHWDFNSNYTEIYRPLWILWTF